jgi:hypothetical protein
MMKFTKNLKMTSLVIENLLILLFVSLSSAIISLTLINQNENNTREVNIVLESTFNTVKTLFLNDINEALNSNTTDKKFHLVKHFYVRNLDFANPHIVDSTSGITISNNIKIDNGRQQITWELQDICETLARIIPGYITYKIILNTKPIIISNNYKHLPLIKNNIYEYNGAKLEIELGVNESWLYSFESNLKLDSKIESIITLISILILLIIFSYIYLKAKFKKQNKKFESEINIMKINSSNLYSHIKAQHFITNMLTNKANEIFVREATKNESFNGKELDISIFPIVLTESTLQEISLKEFSNDFANYFTKFDNILMKIETTVETLKINHCKESFYQIIFSLLLNVIYLMNEQSSVSKNLVLSINSEQISLTFDSVPISEKNFIKLSKTFNKNAADPFMLDCETVFRMLNTLDISYNILHFEGQNVVRLTNYNGDSLKNNQNIISFANHKKIL